MTEQLAMFDPPPRRTATQHNAELDAWMAARAVPGGWQCPDCGGVDATPTAHWRNHGWMGTRCMRAHLRTNHARHALRTGDLAFWVEATADLRQIAAWRRSR